MTAVLIDHPLAQSLMRASSMNEHLRCTFGEPIGNEWLPAAAIFAADSACAAALIAQTERRLRTKAITIIGSALLQNYQWPVIASAVACYLLDRRVLSLDAALLHLRYNEAGEAEAITVAGGSFAALPDDPDAAHPDAMVVANQDALRERLRTEVETHGGEVIAQICGRLGCKPRGLWLNVADSLAGTLIWLAQEHDRTVGLAMLEAEVDALVRQPGSPLHSTQIGLLPLTAGERSEVVLDRATCCYWYKMEDGDYCTTCPHRTPADREARLLAYMAEHAG
jgi:hypothetical protein